jgi:hypothetical protein
MKRKLKTHYEVLRGHQFQSRQHRSLVITNREITKLHFSFAVVKMGLSTETKLMRKYKIGGQ